MFNIGDKVIVVDKLQRYAAYAAWGVLHGLEDFVYEPPRRKK